MNHHSKYNQLQKTKIGRPVKRNWVNAELPRENNNNNQINDTLMIPRIYRWTKPVHLEQGYPIALWPIWWLAVAKYINMVWIDHICSGGFHVVCSIWGGLSETLSPALIFERNDAKNELEVGSQTAFELVYNFIINFSACLHPQNKKDRIFCLVAGVLWSDNEYGIGRSIFGIVDGVALLMNWNNWILII